MRRDIRDPRLVLGWDHNLVKVIDTWRLRTFNWGHHNCIAFAADVQKALFDYDTLIGLNIEFSDDDATNKCRVEQKCARLLLEYGCQSPYEIIDRHLSRTNGQHQFYQVNIAGRIFDHEKGITGFAIGARLENKVFFMSERGLLEDSLKKSDILWNHSCDMHFSYY